MKKAITVTIPEPCHENWDKMTPTQKGRFCKSCEKEVVDLSQFSDEKIIKTLQGKSNVCGRLKSSQLNRKIKLDRREGPSVLPYAASLLLPFSLLSTPETISNELPSKEKTTLTSLKIGSFHKNNNNRRLVRTTGIILDSKGKPINNVRVFAPEYSYTSYSDRNGKFEIWSLDKELLQLEKPGFTLRQLQLIDSKVQYTITMKNISDVKPILLGRISVKDPNVNSNDNIPLIKEKQNLEKQRDSVTATIKISGTVTDESGIPLPGVNIVIKGTAIGTQTDFDGYYNLEANSHQTLVFSYVGSDTKEILLANIDNVIDVKLEENEELLEGLIVVGGLSVEETDDPNLGRGFETIEERNHWRENRKQAYKNEIAFKKIKQARKKEARKTKRNKNKN